MGTRADFYVGRGEDAEWIGSIAWDGYPSGITRKGDKTNAFGSTDHTDWPEGEHLFDASTEADYRERVKMFFHRRDDVTLPEEGWPWPWNDSRTTDYAYAFDNDKVWACPFGHGWFDPLLKEPRDKDDLEEGEENTIYADHPVKFPDMTDRKNVTLGPRSGLIVIGM